MAAGDDAADALYSAIALQAKAFETEAASESKVAAIVSWRRPLRG